MIKADVEMPGSRRWRPLPSSFGAPRVHRCSASLWLLLLAMTRSKLMGGLSINIRRSMTSSNPCATTVRPVASVCAVGRSNNLAISVPWRYSSMSFKKCGISVTKTFLSPGMKLRHRPNKRNKRSCFCQPLQRRVSLLTEHCSYGAKYTIKTFLSSSIRGVATPS